MVIGGVSKDKAAGVFGEGVDCVAVISEVTGRGLDGDIEGVFAEWGKEERRADP